jgi:hemolysin III
MVPVTGAVGAALIIGAHGLAAKVTCAVFVGTALLLFTCSGIYHVGNWGPVAANVLRRLDHSNIALIIAGTYTPLTVLALPSSTGRILLLVIWAATVLAIGLRMIWLNAPRWSYVPIYVALGWAALWFMPQFGRTGGPAVVVLLLVGGAFYTAGAVIYALKRPNLWPTWFGFHELFHVCTVGGFGCHFAAVWLTSRG